MIKTTIHLMLLAFLIASCSGSGTESEKMADSSVKTMVKPFSDSLKADTFQVRRSSNAAKETELLFTIRSHEGKEIYREEIKADDLFKNYDATIDLKKKKNQVKFLNEELSRFFDEENLMEPAITEQEQPDQYVPDRQFYEELKASQLNGFIYRLGKENKVYIGWSAKAQKVKICYHCCKQ